MHDPFDNPETAAAGQACGGRGWGQVPHDVPAAPDPLATPRACRPGRFCFWRAMAAPDPFATRRRRSRCSRQPPLPFPRAAWAVRLRGIQPIRRSSCSKGNRRLTSKR